jgi:Lhr-like helicase
LYGFDKKSTEDGQNKIVKIIQKILINIDASLALISNEAKDKIRPTLEKIAKEIVEAPENRDFFNACQSNAVSSSLDKIFNTLNANIKNENIKIKINGVEKLIKTPTRKLKSNTSSYILDVLCEHSP